MKATISALKRYWNNRRTLFLCLAFLPGSTAMAMPEGASAVEKFSLERYLGSWYEIARLDHRFERGMTQVTATYSMRDDGGVRVLNMWILAREPSLEPMVLENLLSQAKELGFATDELIYPQKEAVEN